ncbi:MAG: hypothetical protein QUS33_07370 [Dehalococcoidia bacterium]|nr:hypothetical protein [Dehalococcoidia bacterium]
MDELGRLETAGHPDAEWREDSMLRPVQAVVVILGCTLAATTYRTQRQRLLDVLNRSFVANSRRIGKEFLPLTEADALFSTGEKEHLPSTHINKSSILFVAERSGGQPDRSGVPEGEMSLLRAKKALPARIDIPPYVLLGKMYAEPQEGLVHVIDGDDVFLPMTDVFISPALPTGEWKFSFVAINKHQIVRIEESVEAPRLPAAQVRKVRRRKPRAAAPKATSAELASTAVGGPNVDSKS